MSAQHADPVEFVEAPFSRARAHAASVEGTLTTDKMKRAEHSDVEEPTETALAHAETVADPSA